MVFSLKDKCYNIQFTVYSLLASIEYKIKFNLSVYIHLVNLLN